MRNQRQVRGRHRIVAQFVGAYPGEVLSLAPDHRSFPAPANIERHQEVKALIVMTGESQWRKARLAYGDAELLMQLADQRLLRPLAGLDLAAGKFPQARHGLARRALRDQYALVGIDKRAGNYKCELEICHAGAPTVSLRGAKRRSNPDGFRSCISGLLRFARNDGGFLFAHYDR